ncbi:uncharacterized protein MELLADRAFT_101680 [Melampsora larici-populina 98AG31]|uniref:Uncharacterized protein n=1 Tax=Melampsora larici-populina (strain 98AG31 / pathotype 3-4-7) TaxID=747676 RepID=F4R6M3_MELLP|nr:uncharacterized protein MELLADRAFT_101680 [Melampsora larici-populina 98AG31]EGG12436.1 hypothetical protein MELLADRAFT_101680 [Melampsora larici-populina 98AG31]
MTKRKNSKQGPSNPTSPTNKTTPTVPPITSSTHDSKHEPSKDASKNHGDTQYPPIPPPHAPSSFLDPNFIKLQTIASDLRPYLLSNWDVKMIKKITKPQIYRIMIHFDPSTKSCPNQLKDLLIATYEKEVKPLIERYYPLSQHAAGDAMETKQTTKPDLDFDPLSSKTTCQMLRNAIESIEPDVDIPKTARREGLLCLYKAYVDHDITIPKDSQWTSKPRVLAVDQLKRETVEDL